MWRTSSEIARESRANWSKQVHINVTFFLDHADDFLDSNCRKQFLNLLRTVRMLSEQRVTYVITTRKNFKDSELQTGEVRLNPLLPEESKNILVSRVYDKETLANSPSTRLMKIDKILSTFFRPTPKEGRMKRLLSWTPVKSFSPVFPRN